MIESKRVLAVIPARGGSKGVPRKNIRSLGGKPLIAWTIEAAKQSQYIDRLILSSEDDEIIEIVKKYSCEVPFKRPKYLAEDATPGIEPVLHALEQIDGYDLVVLLQPTSPFRTAQDIDKCIEKLIENNSPSCVSVNEASVSPYWMYTIKDTGNLDAVIQQKKIVPRRQELPVVYTLNGAVYAAKIEWLREKRTFLTKQTTAFIMPKERSYDIDSEEDFLWCEYIVKTDRLREG